MGKRVSRAKRSTRKLPARRKKEPGLRKKDPIFVAAQKVFRVHFSRLIRFEKGTRSGENIEDLHQFRVSSRRLRAAVRIFGPYLPGKTAARLREDLRLLTRSCGPARDLDVQIDRAVQFGQTLPEAERPTLQPLLEHWGRRQRNARKRLVDYLDSKGYNTLKSHFEALLKTRSENPKVRNRKVTAPAPEYLGHVAPAVIWSNYQKVRVYETLMADPPVEALHALRIDCKRLRYCMEMVREVLGEAGETAIEVVRKAQEHLGEMHDAHLAAGLVWKIIKRWSRNTERTGKPMADISAVRKYFLHCEAEETKRIETFPAVWAEINSPQFRKILAEATAAP